MKLTARMHVTHLQHHIMMLGNALSMIYVSFFCCKSGIIHKDIDFLVYSLVIRN